MKTWFAISTLLWMIAASVVLGVIGLRILRYPENHISYNILWTIPIFAVLLIHAGYLWLQNHNAVAKWLAVFALLSMIAIVAIYEFNVLLPYETWLRRAMPARPF